MIDRAKIVKVTQDFINHDIQIKEDYKILLKNYNNMLRKLAKLKQQLLIQQENNKISSEIENKFLSTIKIQQDTKNAKEMEMVKVKEKFDSLKEEYEYLECNGEFKSIPLDTTEIQASYKNSSHLRLLKLSTNMFIDSNAPSNIICGFIKQNNSLCPFESDTMKISETELKNNLLELLKKTSNNINNWEKIIL